MIRLVVTMTGKSYSPSARWKCIAEDSHTFEDMASARAWLREQYGKSKRVPMYRDCTDGTTQTIGYIYGFRASDWSHAPVDRWLQQDWVEFRSEEPIDLPARTKVSA